MRLSLAQDRCDPYADGRAPDPAVLSLGYVAAHPPVTANQDVPPGS